MTKFRPNALIRLLRNFVLLSRKDFKNSRIFDVLEFFAVY